MMIFVWLAVGLLVYYLVMGKGSKSLVINKPTPEDVLRERFANGEIDEQTYNQMKETLKK